MNIPKNDCRNCGHQHRYLISLNPFTAIVMDTCYEGPEHHIGRCGCYNFIPADNLEYLESLVDKNA